MTPRRPAPARPGARPGARRTTRTTSRPAPEPQASSPDTAAASPDPAPDREPPERAVLRLGGTDGLAVPARAIILVLVLLLAFVVTFPSLRGYLSQQARYDAVLSDIARARDTSASLEQERAQWQDDNYVKSQARERLAYVMPGETTYVVVGANRFESGSGSGTAGGESNEHRPWYDVVQESARVAGGTEEAPTPSASADPAEPGGTTPTPSAPAPAATAPGTAAPSGASATPSDAPTPGSTPSSAPSESAGATP